jgi:hypothetical protein
LAAEQALFHYSDSLCRDGYMLHLAAQLPGYPVLLLLLQLLRMMMIP